MSHIYLTQKQFDKLIKDPSLITWDGQISYTILENRKTLTCSVCGTQTKGRQWYNRDKGFGICPICYAEEHARAISSGSTQDDLADIRFNYGVYGVHFGKLSDFILQE